MPRYVSRPRATELFDADHGVAFTAGEIICREGDSEFIDSGLLDANGEPLYRARGRIALGFKERMTNGA